LRLAVQADCLVEVVEQCDALTSLGGIGCLLRLRPELQNGTGNPAPGWRPHKPAQVENSMPLKQ
jgi:hypothetical protein